MSDVAAEAPEDLRSTGPAIMHWLWRDPSADPLLASCLATVRDDDCVVLQAEAALASVAAEQWLPGRRGRWLVLRPDLHSLGLQEEDVASDIECISMDELVSLSVRYATQQSWA
ncbi:MAG: DsrH/TusB family sulfur metabolism protein [Pseudomonadota bacterium]